MNVKVDVAQDLMLTWMGRESERDLSYLIIYLIKE